MKKNILKSVALATLLVAGSIAYAQINYNSQNCQNAGKFSSAIGDGCVSNGEYSFAGGWSSRTGYSARSSFSYGQGCVANGNHSLALGYFVTAQDAGATAIGTYLTVSGGSAAIGRGYDDTDRMVVDKTRVIALGFNSNLPTMTIFSAAGKNYTGKVAIGNVTGTEPDAKLHIAGDIYDEADILLQSQGSHKAAVCFQNKNNMISVATGSNTMNFTAGGFAFNSGKVGIGCENNIEGYALAVKGGVVSTRVSVMDVDEWPDYVFGKDYERMSLYELEEYIGLNHHLPEVPSAEEVSEQGIDLGEMNAILLQKVEELTLHVIELQKQIDLQQNEINELKVR